jgi:hypothetical protein
MGQKWPVFIKYISFLKDNVDLTFAILKIYHFKGIAKNIKGASLFL